MAVRVKNKEETFEVVVVGGGMTGICAALASARNGVKTALIHDRPVLGGNASSEVKMHICGASSNMLKPNGEETGIIQEIMLENKRYNDYYNYSIWDAVLLQKVKEEPNLTTYMNTTMSDVIMQDKKIVQVLCYQLTTEIHLAIAGKIFIDCTGNGTLGFMAGADYKTGSEAKAEYDEPDAPEEQNKYRMGNTLLFKAIDRGHPVTFHTPKWARHFTEDDLKLRGHGNYKSLINFNSEQDGIATSTQVEGETQGFDSYGLDYGYWWIEVPGVKDDIIEENEEIRDQLVGCVYGVWDHLKNGGEHGAKNYDLQWVGMLPGMRESRRLVGDYMLDENDVLQNEIFEDAVAYGGWPIDVHTPNGIFDKDMDASFIHNFPGFYTIPYRSYCSSNIDNLLMAGRCLSATRLAMGSSRVMATCAVGGQAVGVAASMCIQHVCMPREIHNHMTELQQKLIKEDCFIPGYKNEDEKDLARTATVSATSQLAGSPATNVINGWTRDIGENSNRWSSDGIGEKGETLTLKLKNESLLQEVRLTFDTNLTRPIKITLSEKRMKLQQVGVPVELVKNYTVKLWKSGQEMWSEKIEDNYQRCNVLKFAPVCCDEITITVHSTNGDPNAHIYEVRAYE